MKLIINLTTLLSSLAFAFVSNSQTMVFFDKGSHKLTENAKKQLYEMSQTFNDPTEEFLLIGHTDSDASNEYNLTLSQKRAKEVGSYLKNMGVKNRFHIEFQGEEKPVNTNANSKEMAENRRVEIIRNFKTNNLALESLRKSAEIFTILGSQDTTITCKQGTEIMIKANSFKTNSDKPIELSVIEVYDKGDFITNNLSTLTTLGEQLISAGMAHIQATQNGENIQLDFGKKIDLKFKDRKEGDEMVLFYGENHGNNVVWESQNSNLNPNQIKNGIFGGRMSTTWGFPYNSGEERPLIIQDTQSYSETWNELIAGQAFEITKSMKRENKGDSFVHSIDTVSINSKYQMGQIIQSTGQLGWINCDRWAPEVPKTDFYVQYEGDFVPSVALVFNEINSVLPYTNRENKTLIFKNIPLDQEFKVIGIFSAGTDSPVLYAESQNVNSNQKKQFINFQEMTKADAANKLKSL